MKRILITGANSYIGCSFEKYLRENYPDDYIVDTVDMHGNWRDRSFAGYDSVFHVAGIAHQKEKKQTAYLYHEINRDLAIEAARKARDDGVKQFIFISSMSVYGMDFGIITEETEPAPKTLYGSSKLEAEQTITSLQDQSFGVSILRPPMIYGKGCKGNYPRLAGVAQKLPVFPYVANKRSMLYIDNLCEFVRLIIENHERGLFWPQNSEYSNTSELVKMIAQVHGKKVFLIKGMTLLLKFVSLFMPVMNKVFGSLYYDMSMSIYSFPYQLVQIGDSVRSTEER